MASLTAGIMILIVLMKLLESCDSDADCGYFLLKQEVMEGACCLVRPISPIVSSV